jgi:hypothetical protein
MKKHEISKLVAGVAFGIMITMLLILRVLGKTWDNIAVSILIGSLAGITLYDYRIIIVSVKSAIHFVKEKLIFKFKIRKGTFWPFLITSIVAMSFFTALFYLELGPKYSLSAQIISAIICYLFLVITVASCVLLFIDDKKVVLKSKQVKKIEKKVIDIFEGNEYDTDGKAAYQVSCLLKVGWEWYRVAPRFFLTILIGVLYLLAQILQGIISIFLLIAAFFQFLGQNKSAVLITLSVTVGTLFGVWQASYVIGLAAGLIFLSLNLILRNIEINPNIIFEKKYSLANKIFGYI